MTHHRVRVHFNGKIIAEAPNAPPIVEGNYYFPPNTLNQEYFHKSAADTHTVCSWKGTASYYDIQVGDKTVSDAAWYYPQCKETRLQNYVAFYKDKVRIEEVDE